MKILAFDHVHLAMPAGEEAKARAFYGGLLGMTEIPKPPELAKRGGAWFQVGMVIIHLGVEAGFRPARKAHPAVLVDNLDAFIARCREHGVEMDMDQPGGVVPPVRNTAGTTPAAQPALEGYKRAHIFDPFGNRFELMEKV